MIRTLFTLLALGLMAIINVSAEAGTLRVSPVRLDVAAAAAAATTVTLRNDGNRPIMVQARVFRWVQSNGEERLEPTRDVVVSPPMAKLQPGAKSVVRVVRTSRSPVQGEETYRVLIDELPAVQDRTSTVSMVVRQSIPLFFIGQGLRGANLAFAIQRRGAHSGDLVVTNHGDRSLRLADLAVVNGSGQAVTLAKGLVGYVHGRSTMRFPLRSGNLKAVTGRQARLLATSELGRIDASADVR